MDERILRFNVELDGRPIYFRTGAVQLSPEGEPVRIFNPMDDLLPPLHKSALPKEGLPATWMRARGVAIDPSVTSGYLALPSHRVTPVVRVESATHKGDAQIYFLDPNNGRILFQEPLFQTREGLPVNLDGAEESSEAVFGAVYLENPRITPDVRTERILNLDEGAVHLYGKYARVETCVDTDACKETAPTAERSLTEGAEFVFDPVTALDQPDPFAEVNVYYNIDSAADWIRSTFGWDGLFAGETWVAVKVGRYWDNAAYYAGSDTKAPYIVFGKTEDINFAYDADTARHEFGHAVNDLFWNHPWSNTDEFGLDISMNALEEAVADMWALSYTGDPLLNGAPGYSRNAANEYKCPKNMVGEGHLDGRFIDGFAWDVREAVGKTAFEQILYRSLSFLDNRVGYDDFVRALEQSVRSLVQEGAADVALSCVDDIRRIADARGLLDPDCRDRIVPLLDRTPRGVVGYGRSRTRKMDYPFPLQWKVTFLDDTKSAAVDFTWLFPETNDDGEPVTPGYRVHVRRGAPVTVEWLDESNTVEGEPAFIAAADNTYENSPASVRFPADGQSPPEPNETFYVLLSADNEESVIAMEARLRLEPKTAPSPPAAEPEGPLPEDDFAALTGTPSCRVTAPAVKNVSSIFSLVEVIL